MARVAERVRKYHRFGSEPIKEAKDGEHDKKRGVGSIPGRRQRRADEDGQVLEAGPRQTVPQHV